MMVLYHAFCSEILPPICMGLFALEVLWYHYKAGEIRIPFLPTPRPKKQTTIKKQTIAVVAVPKGAIAELEPCIGNPVNRV